MSKLEEEMQRGLKSTLYALDLPPAGKEAARAMIKNRGEKPPTKSRTSEVQNIRTSDTSTSDIQKFGSSDMQTSSNIQKSRTSELRQAAAAVNSELPKYAKLEKFDAKLSAEQLQLLGESEKMIMRSRQVKSERITKNSIVRVMVEVFGKLKIDLQEIPDEEELKRRVFESCGIENH